MNKNFIGCETVSSADAIKSQLQTYNAVVDSEASSKETTNPEDSAKPTDAKKQFHVKIDAKTLDNYNQSDRFVKELMGHSMLLGTTFFRLFIYKCPKSIKFLSGEKTN